MLHEMGEGHLEQPARLVAIDRAIQKSGLGKSLRHYEAIQGSQEHVRLVHSADYLSFLQGQEHHGGLLLVDPDMAMGAHTLVAAYRAVGAVILAVDLLMRGEVQNAFCCVRPPGHHARPGEAMGFCFFNNVAIAAKYALKNYGISRLAILDFDVHHGNGTEEIFLDDEHVLVCQTFLHPFYPNKPYATGNCRMINCPLVAGSGSEELHMAVESRWLPALEAFKPELIFMSAGFDAHSLDPIGQLKWEQSDFLWLTEVAKKIASEYSKGRVISVLEGGYDLESLGSCVVAHIRGLLSC